MVGPTKVEIELGRWVVGLMNRVNCQGDELTPAQLEECAEASLRFHEQCVKAIGVLRFGSLPGEHPSIKLDCDSCASRVGACGKTSFVACGSELL